MMIDAVPWLPAASQARTWIWLSPFTSPTEKVQLAAPGIVPCSFVSMLTQYIDVTPVLSEAVPLTVTGVAALVAFGGVGLVIVTVGGTVSPVVPTISVTVL